MSLLDDFEISGGEEPIIEVKDLKSITNSCIISRDEIIDRQPIAISMGTYKYKGNEYPIPLGSYGDFSCIVGASKAKKSFLKSLVLGSYIGGKANENCYSNIMGHDLQDKYVLDIDTEQSRYHSKRAFTRIDEITGFEYENYIGISLRDKNPKERLEIINYLIMESEYRNNLGLVSVDGAADLVNNFNDVTECSEIADNFLTWTSTSKCHLITVLHKNFGSSKPVGHLGSFVLKKAETVLSVDVNSDDNEQSDVVATHSRNKSIPDFSFRINYDWLPEIVEGF